MTMEMQRMQQFCADNFRLAETHTQIVQKKINY